MKNTAWQNAWEDQNPFLGTFYGTGAPKKAGIGWDLKFGDYVSDKKIYQRCSKSYTF